MLYLLDKVRAHTKALKMIPLRYEISLHKTYLLTLETFWDEQMG